MFRFLGCLIVAFVLLVVGATALASWIVGVLLGVVPPHASPPPHIAFGIVLVIVGVLLVGFRLAGVAVGPLAELADATERMADGEPGVRVEPRGPRAARNLAVSFNTMAAGMDRARDERRALLADVTHELRTPLTVIAGSLEAMVDGVHPADEAHLAPVLAETQVMSRLLDDLRTLSLAEAGALAIHREPVDLGALAADVVALHRPAAEGAGIVLTATLPPGDPLVTSVDPVRVREILANLVANALRHTPRGGSVTVDVGETEDDALLTVTDTGEGIAADDLGRVFDRFHRRADSGGSGLGLAIVRDLATAHGGSVEARSDGMPGLGASFRVRLPLRD